jgi:predicted dehydrogenase
VTALRAAIAGVGFIGAVHARSALLAGARLVGVAASSADRAAAAAQRLRAERGFASSEELVAAGDVDVVHICTPNRLHAPLAEAALRAGKHLICEKPLATTAEDARRLAALAAETGRVATVPFVYRYNPVVFEARARIAGGEPGAVRLIHGAYLQEWLSTPDDFNWRVDAEQGGASRAFADIGSHWFDLAEFVTGDRVASVCAQTATVVPERLSRPHAGPFEASAGGEGTPRAVDTEDLATVMFRTERGVVGTMLVSQVSPGRKNHLHVEIACERASLRFEQERPETLWMGARAGTGQVWRDPATLSPPAARLATVPVGHAQGYADCFDAFVADTYAAIGGARPDGLPTFYDGARSGAVVDAVLRSAREASSWVEVAGA